MSDVRDPRFPAFDPFGEPVEAGRACAPVPLAETRARRVAVAVFWSLALLFVAGRVHFAEAPAAHTFVSAQAQVGTPSVGTAQAGTAATLR